ncbi:hypothetical protein [Streptomyces sp. NPDC059063]|uniref:hypothetical protein n=1 Tax=unclassified Streptomyces TaxID=2593676 RepID=UPI0036794FA8
MTVSDSNEGAGATAPSPAPDEAPAGAPRGVEPVHVDFPPVENGVHLRSVVDHLTTADPPTPRDLKYAVLHLQAAAEVLLKARLVEEHWSLVFKEPGTATRKKFEDGDFISCTTQAAVGRLRKVAVDDRVRPP